MLLKVLLSTNFFILAAIHAEENGPQQLANAVKKGDLMAVNHLLDSGISANSTTIIHTGEFGDFDCWPINTAASDGNFEIVRSLLDHGSKTDPPDTEGTQPIHLAARAGHLKIVALLIERGVNVNTKSTEWDGGPYQPLELAAESGNLELVEFLIQHGAELSESSNAMAGAVRGKNLEIIQCFLKHGGSLTWKDRSGDSLIHSAYGLPMVRFLVENGAVPTSADQYGNQPIHSAAGSGDLATVSFLLEKGADANAIANSKNSDSYHNGRRPLHNAATPQSMDGSGDEENRLLEIAKLLILKGADTNATDVNGDTPLHLARTTEMTALLIENGAKVDSRNQRKEQPIHRAAFDGDIGRIKILLAHGADLNAADNDDETPLDKAAFWERREMMIFLLDQGARPTERTLLNAVNFGNIENLPLLTDRGVKITSQVYLASDRAREKLLPLLDKEALRGISGTVLTAAVENEDLPKIKSLIAAGVQVDALSPADGCCANSEASGAQAIHFAAACSDAAIIAYLFKNGAKVDATTDTGAQPIHIAAENGKLEIVKFLLTAGAEPKAKRSDGKNAIELAQSNHHPKTAEILSQWKSEADR
jgi:cytohesin